MIPKNNFWVCERSAQCLESCEFHFDYVTEIAIIDHYSDERWPLATCPLEITEAHFLPLMLNQQPAEMEHWESK